MIAGTTVEQRIISEFHCSVGELLGNYAREGMTSKQVAEILQCGVSNVRRIARKYNVRFNQPSPQPKIVHSEEFLCRAINSINFLSRNWAECEEAEVEMA